MGGFFLSLYEKIMKITNGITRSRL
jgi:hypothetical protein